jgi:uncharacterized membrane protein
MSTQTAHERSKHPRSILAGPYGHPFHAILVTIPIGSWVAALVFDLVALFGDNPGTFAQGARLLVGIGIVGALLAAVAGLLDYSVLTAGTRAKRIATIHLVLNVIVICLMAISFYLRSRVDEVSISGFVVSLIALAALSMSGVLGGELAYRFGVRVADEKTQRDAFEG